MSNLPQEQQEAPKKGKGCFFYGCVVLVILGILVIAGILIGLQYAKNWLKEQLDDKPQTLPTITVTDEESSKIQNKFAQFQQILEQQDKDYSIDIDAKEFNVLLAKSQELSKFKDKLYISIEGDKIKGQISLLLDSVFAPKPIPPILKFVEGKYLNGSATFKVFLQNGALFLHIDSLEVKGKLLPEEFMSVLRKENLAKDFERDPKKAEWMRKFESISVQNGVITLKVKGKAAAAPKAPEEPKAPETPKAPEDEKKPE